MSHPCKSCKAEIEFRKNEATGKWSPISLETGLSHFLDCLNATAHSKKNRKPEAAS